MKCIVCGRDLEGQQALIYALVKEPRFGVAIGPECLKFAEERSIDPGPAFAEAIIEKVLRDIPTDEVA